MSPSSESRYNMNKPQPKRRKDQSDLPHGNRITVNLVTRISREIEVFDFHSAINSSGRGFILRYNVQKKDHQSYYISWHSLLKRKNEEKRRKTIKDI
jgi:hypothetical protein